MRPIDSQAKIRELAAVPCPECARRNGTSSEVDPAKALNAETMRSKLAEFIKGGLPSGGSDGRGSAEKPLPLMGNTDRAILTARREYEQALTHAALALESALRLQRAWTVPRTDDTEKTKLLTPEAGKPCSNLWCLHVCSGKKDDVLRNGRCPTCAMYYKRTGVERPRELCDVTNKACSTTATSERAV